MSKKRKTREDALEAEATADLEKFGALTPPDGGDGAEPEAEVIGLVRRAIPERIDTEEDVANAYLEVSRLVLSDRVSAKAALAAAPYVRAGMDTHLQRIRRKFEPDPQVMLPPPPPMRTLTLQVSEPLGQLPERLSGREPVQIAAPLPEVTPPPFGK